MARSRVSEKAETLLTLAQERGENGLHVVGIAEQKAVAELVAAGLVREEPNTAVAPAYNTRIYAGEA